MSGPIHDLSVEAAKSIQEDEKRANQFRTFGAANWLPVPEDKKRRIMKVIQEINDMCKPTLQKLYNPKNYIEIQDRLYRIIKPHENKFNVCVIQATEAADVSKCADLFV